MVSFECDERVAVEVDQPLQSKSQEWLTAPHIRQGCVDKMTAGKMTAGRLAGRPIAG